MLYKILQAVTPAFGRLAAIEARLEGDYRAGVGRVGRESEEIAQVSISRRIYDFLRSYDSQFLQWWSSGA